jgi:hypothetical protein
MNPVTWILELTPEFTDPELLTKHVQQHVTLEYSGINFRDWPQVQGPAVAFGTFRCLTQMQRNPDLCNFIFDDYAQLACTSYYSYLYRYLGRLAFIVPMSALPHMQLAPIFGSSIFIRPDSNKKPFEAAVVPLNSIEHYLRSHPQNHDELVVVSEVLQIDREFRCFCRNGKVFAHSSYKEDVYSPAPPEVIAFAEEIATDALQTLGLNMLTVDVAVCGDTLKLIEIGGVNSWGFYGCDLKAFIEVMEAEARERFAEAQS